VTAAQLDTTPSGFARAVPSGPRSATIKTHRKRTSVRHDAVMLTSASHTESAVNGEGQKRALMRYWNCSRPRAPRRGRGPFRGKGAA